MTHALSRDTVDERLQGVIGPLVTVFDSSGEELDLAEFVRNIEAHLAAGQCGVLIAGSTGEAALLDENERAELVEAARAAVPEDRALLVGVGAESSRATARRAREAAARGADGVLVVSPHYYTAAMSAAALQSHFTRVADESPVPVLLYNIPKYTHFVLQPAVARALAEHPNVIGMKDSSGDLELLKQYLDIQRDNPRFTVLTGNGPTFAPALELGARGGILAVALFTHDVTVRIFAAWARGDVARSRELQETTTAAGREIVGGMGVAGVKAAMDFAGLAGGAVRLPLLPIEDRERLRVEQLLRVVSESTQTAVT